MSEKELSKKVIEKIEEIKYENNIIFISIDKNLKSTKKYIYSTDEKKLLTFFNRL
ncbi:MULTISPECIES: hypothetical protein [Oceanotoga]|jgi:hypothetical protein|uniref:Uncharacterized protein n=1 Tax=Oceanotoga teriensis TaxID=515440 RepID=A0AA45C8Z0_9BACT|nr:MULTISPECIES: hypothetical protein [Oceanotoga]MDN5343454.1 hypothetical protein [Oceanotoga sp.]MDO7977899.1 hypothetical protein [Oceanotoga teriensis]PWJ96474.1 hypothetical protein C7380_10146 [Oceanotoga teriensis]